MLTRFLGSFAVVCLMTGKIVNVQLTMQESDIMGTGLNDTSPYTSIQIATAVSFAVGGFQVSTYLHRTVCFKHYLFVCQYKVD